MSTARFSAAQQHTPYPDVRTTFTVTSLTQDTSVSLAVRWATGTNIADRGAAQSISARTLEDKQAQNLAVSEKTAESVTLTWDNPTNYNVTGYKLERRTGNSGAFTTLEDVTTRGTGLTDSNVVGNTTYTYRVTISYRLSGDSISQPGNSVTLDVTTPDYSDIPAPTNFRITNATLTNGVYVLASHDDHPALAWNRSPAHHRLQVHPKMDRQRRHMRDQLPLAGSCPGEGHRPQLLHRPVHRPRQVHLPRQGIGRRP